MRCKGRRVGMCRKPRARVRRGWHGDRISTTPSVAGGAKVVAAVVPRRRCPVSPTASSRAGEAYGQLPLSFEPNVGQAGGPFQFLARGSGYGLFLSPTGAVLVLARPALAEEKPLSETALQEPRTTEERSAAAGGARRLARNRQPPIAERQITALRVDLVGADPQAAMAGRGELPGRMNYFKGSDPAQWRANVPSICPSPCKASIPARLFIAATNAS